MDASQPVMRVPLKTALQRLKGLHPQARMWNHGEVGAGQIDGESSVQSFVVVHMYEHDITEHFRTLSGHRFIIANGFMASHAYNLALVWLDRAGGRALRQARFRHNFKKFYAETLLHARDVMIGRAFLLETLAYEKGLMRPIFDAAAADPQLAQRAADAGAAMSQLAQHHELGHYFQARAPAEFAAELPAFLDGCLDAELDALRERYAPQLVEEVLCDGVAAQFGVFGDEGGDRSQAALTARLRRTAFGFQAFFRLMDLRACARITADAAPDDTSAVALGSQIRPKDAPPYSIGRQPAVALRAEAMQRVLAAFAQGRGLVLYGEDGEFPLLPEAWEDLDAAFERFADVAEDGVPAHLGCDAQGRSLMRLVAESLSQHPGGTEHLLWRSKRFAQGGTVIDS
jgi:hypothetical protein